ncbi:portal protein [Escherichia phage phi191]|uniref:Uncharacterized protein n=1 Tax=Escherichia phage phi191 TaxID=1458706 RepID=A0A096XEV0_9CAUD|nr:portal protein [Escherichia phage phi191]AHJ10683.1 hypothetical protein phi191_00087 [Escherichia phage phi191]
MDPRRVFLSVSLLSLCSDIDSQPLWRDAANKACAYYDGDQLAPEVIQVLKDRGQPMTIHNLTCPHGRWCTGNGGKNKNGPDSDVRRSER